LLDDNKLRLQSAAQVVHHQKKKRRREITVDTFYSYKYRSEEESGRELQPDFVDGCHKPREFPSIETTQT